jgi:hypothetical protein
MYSGVEIYIAILRLLESECQWAKPPQKKNTCGECIDLQFLVTILSQQSAKLGACVEASAKRPCTS